MAPIEKRRHGRGILFALGNCLGGAVSGLLSKLSLVYNPFVFLMWSYGSILMCLTAIVTYQNIKQLFRVKTKCEKLAIIGCTTAGPAGAICSATSIVYMEFADSFAIQQSNVILCTLLAWVLLKEPLICMDWLCLVMTMTGVMFIARPPFIFGQDTQTDQLYSERWKGILLAVCAAFLSSLFGVSRRKILRLDSVALAFFQTGVGFPLSTVLALTVPFDMTFVEIFCGNAIDKYLLAQAGLLHGVCVLCNLGLFRYLPAVYAMMLKALGSVFSYALQIIFSLEPISWFSMVGSLLIVVSVIFKVLWIKCSKTNSTNSQSPTSADITVEYTCC